MRRRWLPLVAGLALPVAGCMQLDYGIALNRDLSGTADLDMTLDLDRVAWSIAAMEAAMAGEEGPPTREQIEAARKDLLQEMEEDDRHRDENALRRDIEEDLPDGVTLRYAEETRDGLKRGARIGLAFDHVDRLQEMQLGDEEDDEGFRADSRPFEGLRIEEDGDEIVVRNEAVNPVAEIEQRPMVSDEMVRTMMKDLRITFRLTSPFRVVEHNATKVEGKTLVWVFDFDRLQSGKGTGIYARLAR